MSQNISFKSYECYRIDNTDYSLLYYPLLKLLNIQYFDSVEDDEVETTIWTENEGYDLDNSPIKTIETIDKDLQYMRSFQ